MNAFPILPDSKEVQALSNLKKIELAEWHLRKNVPEAIQGDEALEEAYPLKHFVANGTYSRQIFLPAGHTVVGKTHNYEHTNILSQGEVTILTPEGMEHRKAPDTWVSPAGTKRLIRVHSDTIWTTIHRTMMKDPKEIVKKIAHDSDLSWADEFCLLSGDNK